MIDMQSLAEACSRARSVLPPDARPGAVAVLGSGWSDALAPDAILGAVDYADIPLLGAPGIAGHAGRLLHVRHGGNEALVFAGRRHAYEGAGWEPVVFPVALALELNATALLLTNAAGGIRDDLRPGTLMIVDDHINAMGAGPLTGPHHPLFGARFPDQTCVYDAQLRALLDRTAAEGTDGPAPAHGVYAAVAGPAYETPAEIEALRRLGADAVGMSTVPEATVAHAAGLRVCAVSLIANVAAGRPGAGLLAHDEVLAQTRAAAPRMRRVIEAFLQGAP